MKFFTLGRATSLGEGKLNSKSGSLDQQLHPWKPTCYRNLGERKLEFKTKTMGQETPPLKIYLQ